MRNLKSLVTTLAVLAGGIAYADTPDESVMRARQVQAEMNKGKNYADAWGAASASVDADDVQLRAARHQEAMKAGKDHTDARDMPTRDADAVMANARRHQDAMNSGLDHEDARAASHATR